jgi:hypothetical protein
MKINKVILGLGVVSLMLTSCDKAAEQDYTPAAGVATPPAYFSLDYTSSVVLEEEQESFEITLYRADGGAAQTTPVELTMTTDAQADGLFTVPTASGEKAINTNEKVTAQVTFAEGATEASLLVTYPWDKMKDLSGVEFDFDLSVDGEDTPYFLTSTSYDVMYVPWMSPVDEETGETTCYFLDDLIYSGWRLTGYPTPFKYEVDIQYNPIALEREGKLIYRIQTPYANLGHYGNSSNMFVFEGYDDNGELIKNVMYVNATDPYDVYLCKSNGDPFTDIYNTYYTISPDYGNVGYIDRSACYLADEYCVFNGSGYGNSGGSASLNAYIDDSGKKIIFPEQHFYVVMLGDGEAITYGQELQIWLPGAKEEAEWNDLGMATFTDNLVGYLDDFGEQTYDVPVQQNIKDSSLYRLISPYTNNWPGGGYETDEDYNVEISVSNPECVIVELSETGRELPLVPGGRFAYSNYLTNVANLTMNYYTTPWTEAQVISQGMNDKFENNVIRINNPILWFDNDNEDIVSTSDFPEIYFEVVLPSADNAPRYVTKAAKNKLGTRRSSEMKAHKLPLLHSLNK